jgi:hypothetical protein
MKIAWDRTKLRTVIQFDNDDEMVITMGEISKITKTNWEVFEKCQK